MGEGRKKRNRQENKLTDYYKPVLPSLSLRFTAVGAISYKQTNKKETDEVSLFHRQLTYIPAESLQWCHQGCSPSSGVQSYHPHP